ncbi:hypothetical protein PBI_THONKO_66 [Mycobacterium phage Thonko]|uniref:Uncharacterized protein n=1 Tax=Mycobacterium phage Thonko TaxID=2282910 RepID=A0A346FCB3_9CAUD|nr:hypothetical protein I5G57_gp066 [Mycobacterium phage Thonko]AXN53338.1 hypothetical protein PBI_THONKO_66 [Mycobacterium phage Thonko]
MKSRRSRPRTPEVPPDVEHIDTTLADYAVRIRKQTDGLMMFDDVVLALAVAREKQRQIKELRAAAHARCKALAERGAAGAGPYRFVTTVRTTTKTAVPSEKLKAAHPKLWAAARVRVPYVAVKPPKDVDLPVTLPRLPVCGRLAPPEQAAAIYLDPAYKNSLALVKEDIEDAKAVLNEIADRIEWDGHALHFADGWRVTTSTLRYESDMLAVIAPDVFDALAEKRTTESETLRIVLGEFDPEGDIEAD